MKITKYLLISYLVFLSQTTFAQIDTTQMDRMNKSDLVANKAVTDVKVVSASRSSRSVNDVPISTICRNIEIDVLEMMGEKELPDKLQPHNDILL